MSSRGTVLRDPRHREFLQSERRDPVTHEVFAPGDRVTRCARCLLPFLQQSWEAIGRTHCGQLACIGLDDVEPSPSAPATFGEDQQKDSPPEAARLELAPIPIELLKVPIRLR